MLYRGACHCEAIGFAYETALAPQAWTMRACGCRFCRAHAAATTSDPGGTLELIVRDAAQLNRYRFGLATADFWVCHRCGVYLAAVTGDPQFGIINTHALIDRTLPLPPPQAVSYDGETPEARLARRHQRWTPARYGADSA
jgi:hypothetical protein